MDQAERSALELATDCLIQFDKCLSIENLARYQWAENRRADFNLWVDGIGAAAAKKASLDARLESRPRELALVKSLLLNLRNYLDDCLTSYQVDSLEVAKQSVDSSIDNLVSIAVAIRQTGRKSRLLKADRVFNPDNFSELREYLKFIVHIRPNLIDGECREHHYEAEPNWWQSQIRRELTPLQERLVNANLQRRNRFLYAQRHAQKLSQRWRPTVLIRTRPMSPQSRKDEKLIPNFKEENSQSLRKPQTSNPRLPDVAPTLSGTSASIPESKLQWAGSQKIIQSPKTQISSIANAAKYPKILDPRKSQPESVTKDGAEQTRVLKCPCCCEVLPYSMLEVEKEWKKHLSADICPYTCIAENCEMPHVIYRTRVEWEGHIKKHHRKKWKCQLCGNDDVAFFSEDDLTGHIKEEHRDSFPLDLIGTVRLWPSTPRLGLNACPLCPSTGPEDAPDLVNHILEHTHDFALRSLPWADKNADPPASSEIYNFDFLQFSELPGSTSLYRWLNELNVEAEIQATGQWKQTDLILRKLIASRARLDTNKESSYFMANDYFGSEADSSVNARSKHSFSSQAISEASEVITSDQGGSSQYRSAAALPEGFSLYQPHPVYSSSPAAASLNDSYVVGSANVNIQKADTWRALYQTCVSLNQRLIRVPGFGPFLQQLDPADPVDPLWNLFRTGYPLLTIYNSLEPTKPLKVEDSNASETKLSKIAVFEFIKACKDELRVPPAQNFMIHDLMGNDTSGFNKVTQVVNYVLDIAEQRGLLLELQPRPDSGPAVAIEDSQTSYADHIVKELVESERKYVQSLENLHDLKGILEQNGLIPGDAIHQIFLNINGILDFQQRFLIRVEITNSLPKAVQRWGEQFCLYEGAFNIYQPFIGNQRKAAQIAKKYFEKIQQSGHPIAVNFNTLHGYLLRPMQRLMNYPSLLRDLAENSEDIEVKDDVITGCEAAERVLHKVNKAVNRDLHNKTLQEVMTEMIVSDDKKPI